MSGSRPVQVLDVVCGMSVDVGRAEAASLTVEHDGRTYAFCGQGCLRAFREDPGSYADVAIATAPTSSTAPPIIDEGMRRWYESCSCCLSDAYPEIKAALDAERAASAVPPVAAGICEVADATQEVLAR